jgi:hypothetical protein
MAEDEYGVARDRRYSRALNSNTTLAKLRSLATQQAEERLSVERLPTIVGEDETAANLTSKARTRNGTLTTN